MIIAIQNLFLAFGQGFMVILCIFFVFYIAKKVIY